MAGLTLTATPARHFCGRGLRNEQHTLWASWVVAGPEHRVYHSGDTGYFPGFKDIGAEHGPFDATMIQIGAYSDFWPDIHMRPEEGMRAHLDLQGGPGGGPMLPIHWGTFNLAPHPWAEPGEGTFAAGRQAGAKVALPCPGEPFEPTAETLPAQPWWRGIATQPAEGWPDTEPADRPDTGATPSGTGAGAAPASRRLCRRFERVDEIRALRPRTPLADLSRKPTMGGWRCGRGGTQEPCQISGLVTFGAGGRHTRGGVHSPSRTALLRASHRRSASISSASPRRSIRSHGALPHPPCSRMRAASRTCMRSSAASTASGPMSPP